MKLYFVEIHQVGGGVTRLIFVNAFNRFKGYRVNESFANQLYRPDADRVRYDDWDNAPSLFGLTNINTMYDLTVTCELYIQNNDYLYYTINEITGEQRKWWLESVAHELIIRCLADIRAKLSSATNRLRFDTLLNAMQVRLYPRFNNGRRYRELAFEYKNRMYSAASTYRYDRQRCKDMAKLIAQSLHEQSDVFSDTFMQDYDLHSSIDNRIATAAYNALREKHIDVEIAEQHCNHWDYPHNTVEVNIGRGRYRDYCQHCGHDDDIVIETYDTGILMLRDEAYWCDGNEEYYEHEPERDEDDDDDSGDPDSLMSYSTNVLNVLNKDDSFDTSAFGEFHMGVELELVTSGYVSSAVSDLRLRLGEDYVICKSDGSLPSGGVEVVTAPRKLSDHITRFKAWEVDSKYTAWNNNRCGMHVHIDSHAFTRLTLGKFIMFMNAEDNADFIRKLAGRHPKYDEQARSYCAAEGQVVLANPSKALKGKSQSRYYIVNTTCLSKVESDRLGVSYVGERRFNTIELRIFRASLKKERLLAQIEFAHALVMFCRVASYRELDGVSFLKWLKSTDNRYPHLADWYGIRRRVGAKNCAPAEITCADVTSVPVSV